MIITVIVYIYFVIICRKTIPLIILEEGSYEKDVLFYVNLGEPQMVGGKIIFIEYFVYYNNNHLYIYKFVLDL